MDYRQLDRLTGIFCSLLVPLTAGCDGGPIDSSQFTEDLCGEQGLQVLDAIEPLQPVDYVELRLAEQINFDEESPEFDVTIVDASGQRCAGASDPAACEAAFDALSLESEFTLNAWDFGQYESVALTRADTTTAITTNDALRTFLGPIDAPGDAALFARLSGHSLECSGNDVGEHPRGFVVHTRAGTGCPSDIEERVVLVTTDGVIEVLDSKVVERGDPGCAIGRLPAGLCRRSGPAARDPMGSFFAEVAHLEAASVTAFGQLARELELHGAPRAMVRDARRSRQDEIRHARATARLARRFGGRPVAPRVRSWTPRALVDVATDNATEGCIRETYGALVAHAQARRARDPHVRRVLGAIARDETRHAALSWSLDRWARSRMSAAQRRAVARRTKDALERLEGELTQAQDPRVHEYAGMPIPGQARALYRGLRRALFADFVA